MLAARPTAILTSLPADSIPTYAHPLLSPASSPALPANHTLPPQPGFSAAVSQNLFGAAAFAGPGPACGTCYRLTIRTLPDGVTPTANAGTSIVVMVNNLCPATADNPLCAQPDLQTPNQYGGVVDFNLCNDDGAHAALLGDGDGAPGLAVGTAVEVSCAEAWVGSKKEDCGSDCGGEGGLGSGASMVMVDGGSLWLLSVVSLIVVVLNTR